MSRIHTLPIKKGRNELRHCRARLFLVVLALTGGVSIPLASWASPELAKTSACLACHSVDKKFIGPAFKEIAAKYGNAQGAEVQMRDSILKGSSGRWGTTDAMPANQLNEADAARLVKWILGL